MLATVVTTDVVARSAMAAVAMGAILFDAHCVGLFFACYIGSWLTSAVYEFVETFEAPRIRERLTKAEGEEHIRLRLYTDRLISGNILQDFPAITHPTMLVIYAAMVLLRMRLVFLVAVADVALAWHSVIRRR